MSERVCPFWFLRLPSPLKVIVIVPECFFLFGGIYLSASCAKHGASMGEEGAGRGGACMDRFSTKKGIRYCTDPTRRHDAYRSSSWHLRPFVPTAPHRTAPHEQVVNHGHLSSPPPGFPPRGGVQQRSSRMQVQSSGASPSPSPGPGPGSSQRRDRLVPSKHHGGKKLGYLYADGTWGHRGAIVLDGMIDR